MEPTGRLGLAAALAVVTLAAGASWAVAEDARHPTDQGEIVLSEHGYFFVGGRYVHGDRAMSWRARCTSSASGRAR